MSIYEQLKAANIPIDHHESDLYAKVTPESQKIIDAYEFKDNVKRFVCDDIKREIWFDIPFAFDPFWQSKSH